MSSRSKREAHLPHATDDPDGKKNVRRNEQQGDEEENHEVNRAVRSKQWSIQACYRSERMRVMQQCNSYLVASAEDVQKKQVR